MHYRKVAWVLLRTGDERGRSCQRKLEGWRVLIECARLAQGMSGATAPSHTVMRCWSDEVVQAHVDGSRTPLLEAERRA